MSSGHDVKKTYYSDPDKYKLANSSSLYVVQAAIVTCSVSYQLFGARVV